MNVKVIVFDLDDTLYNEIDFVKSGFMAVSKYFTELHTINQKYFFNDLMEQLKKNGRGEIFNNVLKKYHLYNKTNVKKAISIYRTHIPNIKLPQATELVLEYYKSKSIPMYVVTDGNKNVQYNKIKALNIEQYFQKVFITHRFGIKNAKPSPYCFCKIADLENVNYLDIVYIGDNINKDFISLKPLGFRTIRIHNGMFKNIVKSDDYQAEVSINSIDEIVSLLRI